MEPWPQPLSDGFSTGHLLLKQILSLLFVCVGEGMAVRCQHWCLPLSLLLEDDGYDGEGIHATVQMLTRSKDSFAAL